ncbi:MAG: prepilin-type N-terminal cleavage/methylation domain-containing protein [Candidatus Marinimicrobia bacterium]|nr:prepilin-type N-terminal cleavage/methylation domain-containing protein [Candidatus Neomarinimicrobiota bacterium]
MNQQKNKILNFLNFLTLRIQNSKFKIFNLRSFNEVDQNSPFPNSSKSSISSNSLSSCNSKFKIQNSTFPKGFTLMEIVVAIAAISIILVMISGIMARTGQIYEFMIQRKDISKQSRQAQDHFFQEVKLTDSLGVADSHIITFRDGNGYLLTYQMIDNFLKRTKGSSGSPQILITYVDMVNSQYKYYDSDHIELTSLPLNSTELADTRYVEFILKLQKADQFVNSRRMIYLENFRW